MASALRLGDEIPASMIERMTLIMDSFEGPQMRLTLDDVCGRTTLPRSTTHRILEQLVRLRWLDRDGRDYGLGPRALGLGGKDVGHGALRTAAFPLLHALATQTEMVVHLGVLDGSDVYYLDKFGGRAAIEVPSLVGGRAPAHCTAMGKSILAWLPPEYVDRRFRSGVHRRTPRTIGDLGLLHQELSRIRARKGLAFERGECFPHIACVGTAIRGPEGPMGGISVVGGVDAPLERLVPLVAKTAQAIGDKLLGAAAHRPRPDPLTTASGDAIGELVALGERSEWL